MVKEEVQPSYISPATFQLLFTMKSLSAPPSITHAENIINVTPAAVWAPPALEDAASASAALNGWAQIKAEQ